MGEENKEEQKKEETKEKDKKEEKKKEEEPPEIVLKVDMHCEACARKVARALKGFEGVEDVAADSKASKVVVKGKTADPIKVCERLQKKSGRKVELISPLPSPQPPEEKKEEIKEEKKQEEAPAVITVVLNVRMHCEACAQGLRKRIRKIQGVESVETNLTNDQVIVKGVVDPEKLVSDVYKKTRKQASIVKKDEEKKEEEKKEEEEENKKKDESKEGGKKDGEEESKGQGEEDKKLDIKRSEYYSTIYHSEYAFTPQIFSDENPNACSVM